MNDIEKMIQDITNRQAGVEMALGLLYAVVERTGNTTEGFFSLRKVNDLAFGMNRVSTSTADYLLNLENIQASIEFEIDRIEAV